jgi:hypothetical protein
LLWSLDGLLNACWTLPLNEARSRSEAASEDERAAILQEYRQTLAENLSMVEARLDALVTDLGNAADAEIAAYLGHLAVGAEVCLHDPIPGDEWGCDVGLVASYSSAFRRMRLFMASYPWAGGSCHPDPGAIRSRLAATISRGKEAGARFGPEYDTSSYGFAYAEPSMAFVADHGWWYVELYVQSELEHYRAFWENYTEPRLPTQAEAAYILANLTAAGTDLTTERLTYGDRLDLGVPEAWMPHPLTIDKGLLVRTLPAMEWHFPEAACSA